MIAVDKNESLLYDISASVIDADAESVTDLVHAALKAGVAPRDIIDGALIPAMDVVGDLFAAKEIYVPELYMSAQAMVSGLSVLEPLLTPTEKEPAGRIVMGTVQGDLHDIGKNLVALMLRGAGFKVTDLGVNVPPQTFVDAVREVSPQIMGMSSLLTTTMPAMKATLDALVEAGLRDRVKVIVGGAPVTQRFADDIGADGHADNCSTAVVVARSLLEASS